MDSDVYPHRQGCFTYTTNVNLYRLCVYISLVSSDELSGGLAVCTVVQFCQERQYKLVCLIFGIITNTMKLHIHEMFTQYFSINI